MADAEKQLRAFIAKFEPRHQALIRSMRKAMRARLPGAYELVYDNYNFFVIGYSPTERTSDAILSIAAGASGINLFFLQGAKLGDPDKVLLGSGKQVRFIRVPSVDVLKRPEIRALISAAVARSKRFDPAGGDLVIRSISAKQRPRRKAKT